MLVRMMGHRVKMNGAEWDAVSRFGKKYLAFLQQPHARSNIKRGMRRRERLLAKAEIRRGDAE